MGPEGEPPMTATDTSNIDRSVANVDEVDAIQREALDVAREAVSLVAAVDEKFTYLRERLDQVVAEVRHVPSLEEARAACNEAGIFAARRAVNEALAAIDEAQSGRRAADAAVTVLAEQEAAARLEAEWELDGRFVTEANKTYLVLDDGTRKQMTADERRAWKTGEADRVPTVAEAKRARLHGEERAAAARDQVASAERRFSAAKRDLDASIAVLETLRIALTIPTHHAIANGGAR